jgi:hypothetical protein
MIFEFICYSCGVAVDLESKAFTPPSAPRCVVCEAFTDRVYGCNIDTSACKDPDDIAIEHRTPVAQECNLTSRQANAIEKRHQEGIAQTRRDIADGGNRGSRRMTHQIPAALHAAKIKETGDREYWSDPKNRNRHKSCKVD